VSARSFAFLGSGEFEAWHDDVDRWLLDRAKGDGSVVVAPTASAPEGDEVFASWATKGLEHYRRLGVDARVLPVKIRGDASDDQALAMVRDASMIFFSGGNPWHLARVLEDTPLWRLLVERLDTGLAYAGCSAGVAFLTEKTYDSDTVDFDDVFKPGLGYVPNTLFAPHWDIVDGWVPGARAGITAAAPAGGVLVALDEDTAMLGDGAAWSVSGRQGIHVLRDGTWASYVGGDTFDLPLV
jgi:cyanophycinase